jgi:hypothetical protein
MFKDANAGTLEFYRTERGTQPRRHLHCAFFCLSFPPIFPTNLTNAPHPLGTSSGPS